MIKIAKKKEERIFILFFVKGVTFLPIDIRARLHRKLHGNSQLRLLPFGRTLQI